ncbi:MAG: flagellar hook-associated protein FlgL [Desulfobacteraceae bacterium]|nr:flagellar hook-associated protein FlgL [Desulfobacteraceae bacterium]MBC2752854.1 flagellar hook-associated protein FlgL [Desulfobacteraceae bacterium]
MRVTNSMMTATVKRNLFRQAEQLAKKQETMASGKRINRPSDDPLGYGKVLDYRKTLTQLGQYDRNIQNAKNRTEFIETTLEGVEELMVDAKNWAVNQFASESMDREAAITSVQNIREQMLQMSNSKMGNVYVFAGFQTLTPPFASDGTYNGDNGYYSVMTADNMEMQLEADGSRIFQGAEDVFDALDQLIVGLQTDDVALIHDQIGRFEQAQDQVQMVRAESGARYQQLQLVEQQTAKLKLTFEEMMDSTEKANIEETVIDFNNQELAYELALNAAAKIIQPTLMDFLR